MSAPASISTRQLPTPSAGPRGEPATFDYADAFELRLMHADNHTAEQWARAGLEQAPRPLRAMIVVAHRVVLGLRLGPLKSHDYVLGWTIADSDPDTIHLRASSPMLHASIVAKRCTDCTRTLTTYLYFDRPRSARLIWTMIGPIHRRVAPFLMRRAAVHLIPE